MENIRTAIANGWLAKKGLIGQGAIEAAAELILRIEEQSIETVRVLFTDQHGILRGKTIVASKLESIF